MPRPSGKARVLQGRYRPFPLPGDTKGPADPLCSHRRRGRLLTTRERTQSDRARNLPSAARPRLLVRRASLLLQFRPAALWLAGRFIITDRREESTRQSAVLW